MKLNIFSPLTATISSPALQPGQRRRAVGGHVVDNRLVRRRDQDLPQRLALIPLGRPLVRRRLGQQLLAVAQILDGDVRALARDDPPGDAVLRWRRKLRHRLAVDFENLCLPAASPAFQAGPSGSTQPMVVEFSASLTGRPTLQTTTAKASASRKLNSGPANATMILSSGGNRRQRLGRSFRSCLRWPPWWPSAAATRSRRPESSPGHIPRRRSSSSRSACRTRWRTARPSARASGPPGNAPAHGRR